MSSVVLPDLLLLLRQRHKGAPVIAVIPGQTRGLQDPGPLGVGAPQLFLDPSEAL